MTIEILMPALSPTMKEGNLVKWHKKEGDTIESGDLLAEIETDKATMEVEAVDEGVLGKILVQEGTENVPVNKAIGLLLEDGEDNASLENYKPTKVEVSPPKEEKKSEEKKPQPTLEGKNTTNTIEENVAQAKSINSDQNKRILSSPLARRLAKENNINLDNLNGTGPKGRIVKVDIENFLNSESSPERNGFFSISPNSTKIGGFRDEPLSQMRKVISQRLTQSKQEVPHFYVSIDCFMDELLKIRKTLNSLLSAEEKISVNDFIIKACALALKEVPEANAVWMDNTIRYYDNADISVAVSIPEGLITPIIKAAEIKSLPEISVLSKELIKKARNNKLTPEEYQGGTFSISNMGMYGIKQFNAIINQPQACIIAIGAAEKKPIIINDQIKVASVMTATLSVDHRIVDGAVAAKLLNAFKKYIENPVLITLK